MESIQNNEQDAEKLQPLIDFGKDETIEKKTSNFDTFVNLFRGNIGSAILGLPFAFKNAGLWGGFIGMPIICFISVYCSVLLIRVKYHLRATRADINYSYGQIGYECYGRYGSLIVDIFLIFTQTGFSCAYVIFVGKNLAQLIPELPFVAWALIPLPIYWLLSSLRSLKYLVPFSMTANFTLLFGIGVVYYYDIIQPMRAIPEVSGFNLSTFPIFFGVAVYSYEGIGLIVPMQSAMAKPQYFIPILIAVMTIISSLLISFGIMGLLAYGEYLEPGDKSIITSVIPHGVLTETVQALLSFSLLMTFPVQLFPVTQILDTRLLSNSTELKKTFMRIIVATLAVGVAIAIPDFGLFISLVGGLGSSVLSFILPTLFHLRILSHTLSKSAIVFDVLVLIFGAIGGIATTAVAVLQLVEALTKGD